MEHLLDVWLYSKHRKSCDKQDRFPALKLQKGRKKLNAADPDATQGLGALPLHHQVANIQVNFWLPQNLSANSYCCLEALLIT